MVEIEYRRNDGRSYMIYKDEAVYNGYDIKMVQENRIKGIIPMEVMISEGKEQYWYDISGFQALDTWVEDRRAGVEAEGLYTILSSYRDTLRQCRRYLLDENSINLSKENIFISTKDGKVCFCYMPYFSQNSSDSVVDLFEYYMTVMDHSDGRGVKNCYEAYEECRRPNALIEDILVCFESGEEFCDKDGLSDFASNGYQEVDAIRKKPEEEIKIYSDNTVKAGDRLRKISLGDFKWKSKPQIRKKKEKEPARMLYVAEPDNNQEQRGHQTVLLGANSDRILGRLIYQGDGNEKSFVIGNRDFTIGSSPELDAVIKSQTVSRNHARISEKENEYYIEDLNSKNGTKVNGQWLNYKDNRILRKNDRIEFADCEYLFI